MKNVKSRIVSALLSVMMVVSVIGMTDCQKVRAEGESTINIGDLTRTYNGKEIAPYYNVEDEHQQTCYPDLEIKYAKKNDDTGVYDDIDFVPKDVGEYQITVKVVDGSYVGKTEEASFRILPADWSIEIGEVKQDTSGGTRVVTVKPTINGVYLDSTAEGDTETTLYTTTAGYESPEAAGATVTIEYFNLKNTEEEGTVVATSDATTLTSAGSYVVRVKVAGDTNYNVATAELGFNIASDSDSSIEILSTGGKTYDGTPVNPPEYQFKNSGGTIISPEDPVVRIEYATVKVNEETGDKELGTYGTIAPIAAGDYQVKITAYTGDPDNLVTAEASLTISKAGARVKVY